MALINCVIHIDTTIPLRISICGLVTTTVHFVTSHLCAALLHIPVAALFAVLYLRRRMASATSH